jgi:hypothetical protein
MKSLRCAENNLAAIGDKRERLLAAWPVMA